MRRSRCVAVAISLVALVGARGASALQELGHKTLGTLGLDAGSQPESGLYASDGVLAYGAQSLYDRQGNLIPIGVEARAFANSFGIGGTYELPHLHTYVGAAIGLPIARVAISTDNPFASLDDFGLGDLYVRPLKLGWRLGRADLVTGYAFYVPTGQVEPGGLGGVGRGHWTHEFSAGGTLYLDHAHKAQLTALASYELNLRKQTVDITRGDTVQIQGGVGNRFLRIIDLGLIGYALWQVTDDRGSALPHVLAGARDVAYGLGAEVDVTVPALRTKVTLRYTHNLYARARPGGDAVLVGLTIAVWKRR